MYVSLLRYEEICTGFSCKGCLVALQEIFGGMKDVFKGLKVLGRKFALHKINNNCIENNIYKYKHDFSTI